MNTGRATNRIPGAAARAGAVRGLVALVGLVLLVAVMLAPVPLAKRTAQTILNVPAQLLAATVEGIGAIAQRAIQAAFSAVIENNEVNDRLGKPLRLPPDQDVTWPLRPADAPADELECQFIVQGSSGNAQVTATFKVKDTESVFELSRLLVTPTNGSKPIEVPIAVDRQAPN
ncbi:MAG TPA: hypothetical protein VGG64_25440 [Pirellulales bacterium]